MEIMYITLVKKTIPLKHTVYRGFYLPCFASRGILYVRCSTKHKYIISYQITPITKVLRYLALSEKGLPKSNEPMNLIFPYYLKAIWSYYPISDKPTTGGSRLKFSSIHSPVSKRASKNCTRCTSFASARAPHWCCDTATRNGGWTP